MSAMFTHLTAAADLRATADARDGLELYGLLELRRATDRRIAVAVAGPLHRAQAGGRLLPGSVPQPQ